MYYCYTAVLFRSGHKRAVVKEVWPVRTARAVHLAIHFKWREKWPELDTFGLMGSSKWLNC